MFTFEQGKIRALPGILAIMDCFTGFKPGYQVLHLVVSLLLVFFFLVPLSHILK